MKQVIAAFMVVMLAGCVSVNQQQKAQNEAQLETSSNATAFIGRIETAHGKGGFANPHLIIEVVADDGKKAIFYLRENAIVTDVDGKRMNYMSNAQKGKKVEIKYSVTDGQKEVLSMRYID